MMDLPAASAAPQPADPRRLGRGRAALLALILATSAAVRLVEIGRASFWYDEVVTLKLARSPGPAALIGLLKRIDATRAPLHPLMLQGWIAIFGPGEAAARTLSVAFGFGTVALLFAVGRRAFGTQTGLWAAWLGAISPLLIQYSREARMYAFLAFLTCLAWWFLLGFRRSAPLAARVGFGATLVALAYTHPLGLLMIATLALGYFSEWPRSQLRIWQWFAIQAVVALAVLPWIGRYFDHPPESTVGRLPIRFLLGLPIGYIGGDSRALIGCGALIAFGLFVTRRGEAASSAPTRTVHLDDPASARIFLTWLIVPPVVLYAYSLVGHPIFGPARYMLFVGPAYLILIARGLARIGWFAIPVAAALAFFSARQARESVFDPNLKADWKSAARLIREDGGGFPVVIVPTTPGPNFELETARYYLGPDPTIFPVETALKGLADLRPRPDFAWFAVGIRERRIAPYVPESLAGRWRGREDVWLDGLKLELRQRLDPNTHRPSRANSGGR